MNLEPFTLQLFVKFAPMYDLQYEREDGTVTTVSHMTYKEIATILHSGMEIHEVSSRYDTPERCVRDRLEIELLIRQLEL